MQTTTAPKPTIMSWLQLRPEFHRVIRRLKVVELASKVLALRPLHRRLPAGTQYRVRYGESLLMADEIFKRQVYRDPFRDRMGRRFVDLGGQHREAGQQPAQQFAPVGGLGGQHDAGRRQQGGRAPWAAAAEF